MWCPKDRSDRQNGAQLHAEATRSLAHAYNVRNYTVVQKNLPTLIIEILVLRGLYDTRLRPSVSSCLEPVSPGIRPDSLTDIEVRKMKGSRRRGAEKNSRLKAPHNAPSPTY